MKWVASRLDKGGALISLSLSLTIFPCSSEPQTGSIALRLQTWEGVEGEVSPPERL